MKKEFLNKYLSESGRTSNEVHNLNYIIFFIGSFSS